MIINKPGTKLFRTKNFTSHKGKVAKAVPAKSKQSIKSFKQIQELNKMLSYTLPILFPCVSTLTLQELLSYIVHLYRSKGPEYVIRYLKATQESIETLLFQLDATPQYEKVSIGLDSDLWPKWLGLGLKRKVLYLKDLESIRLVTTLCSLRRLITVPTYTNLESITATPTYDEGTLRHIREVNRELAGEHGRTMFFRPIIGSSNENTDEGVVVTTPTPPLEISLKAGPNGISFFSFPWDRAAIYSNSAIQANLMNFASTYYSGPVSEWFYEKLEPYAELNDFGRQLHIGKISLTFEGGKLKPRVFAIVDSFSQTLLRPFHNTLMGLLRRIKEDCTFDHNKVKQVAHSLYSNGHTFYGYADLSNASDAIPKELYRDAGNDLCDTLGDSWVSIFDRDFHLPKSVKDFWKTNHHMPNSVQYNTGQPMGALSSWPFMAYVHHRIVWTAFGGRHKSLDKYLILGDDIVIFDESAYYKYCNLLHKLGIPFTHNVSKVGFEFAKRVFFKGTEVTGAYTAALWASRNQPEVFSLEWRGLASRGYKAGLDLHPSFRTLLKVSAKRFEKCKLLMTVPYGTEIPSIELAKFTLDLTGRSSCFLTNKEQQGKLVEPLKAFRQAASLLIQQQFQKWLDEAKDAVQANARTFSAVFQQASGLSDHSTPVVQTAINEYLEERTLHVYYLERDLKKTYMGGTQLLQGLSGGEVKYVEPTLKVLLRPKLPHIPRLINFNKREKHMEQLKFRAVHQLNIIHMLRG